MPLERSLLHACERELKRRGITYRKRHGTAFGTKGDPDLFLLHRGIHVEVELKRVGEQPTPLQQLRLEEWRQAGAVTAVVHTIDELRAVLLAVEHLAEPFGR
jgi:hypothetical protein